MSLKSNYEYIRDWCNHKFLTKDEQVSVDLSNYYTKSEVDSAITDATDDIDLSGYVTDGELATGLSTKQNTISDLSTIRSNAAAGAAKISNVQSDWNATSGLAQILNKPDLSEYMTVADYEKDEEVVAAALNDLNTNKQATLVSGTNIKTINNTSILGSGNISVPTKTSDLTNDSGFLTSQNVEIIEFTGNLWDSNATDYITSAPAGTFTAISNAVSAGKIVVLRNSALSYSSTDWSLNFYGSSFAEFVITDSGGSYNSPTSSLISILNDDSLSIRYCKSNISVEGNGNAITNIIHDTYSDGNYEEWGWVAQKGATFALASDVPYVLILEDDGMGGMSITGSVSEARAAYAAKRPVFLSYPSVSDGLLIPLVNLDSLRLYFGILRDNTFTQVSLNSDASNIQFTQTALVTTSNANYQPVAYTAISSASSSTTLAWNTVYQWTVNPTSISLTLPSAPTDSRGEIVLKFTTGSTAPTVTWPSGLKWANGEELTVEASTTYEFSIGYDMMGGFTILGCGFTSAS